MQLYSDLAMALDPTLLFRHVVGSDPDDWQSDFLNVATLTEESKLLALIGRQAGKTRVVSVVSTYWACYDYAVSPLTVIASGSLSQSQEVGRAVFAGIRSVVGAEGVKSENMTRLELRNGARVICLPCSDTVRGLSNARIIADESQLLDETFFAALEPMGAVCKVPKFIVLGTATSRQTKFFQYYDSKTFHVWERRSDQCPRISKKFLQEKRESLGDVLYGAEFECKWIQDGAQAISDELLEAAINRDYVPLEAQK